MSAIGPLRVAILSTQAGWRGGEEQARLLATGLRDRGHGCVFLARRNGRLARRMEDNGFQVVSFSGNGWNPAAVWRVRRALREFRPDMVHYNDSHSLTAGAVASLGLRIPARVAARRVDFPVRSAWRYRLLCDRMICVSRAVADVCAAGGIPRPMLRVVYDGVDPARIRSGDRARGRRSLGAAAGEEVLLTVAGLTDHKGLVFLLYALPAVLAKRPQVRLFLAGEGELRRELEDKIRSIGIADRVSFLGFRDDVPDLIHAADLFVFPSHLEGFGSTLIDVMLAGRPIVTTTAGGIPEVTGSDDPQLEPTAWSVPPRHAPALTAAILEALASPDERARRTARARTRAEGLFTADRMIEATLDVYGELLDK